MQAKSSQFFTSLRHLLSKDHRQYVYVSLTHLYIIVGKISFFSYFQSTFADGYTLFRKSPNATFIDFWWAFQKNIDSMVIWVNVSLLSIKKIQLSNHVC